jgi:hypothetical protein
MHSFPLAALITLPLLCAAATAQPASSPPAPVVTTPSPEPGSKRVEPNVNSSGQGGLGGMSTSGAGTGGMTTAPADGTTTSKPKVTEAEGSVSPRGSAREAPEVPDAKNTQKRRWE